MEPLLLRKRWLHRLGERWASDILNTQRDYATAEDEGLIAAATLIPDAVIPDLPRLPLDAMNELIAFDDEDANADIEERDLPNYPGILKEDPTLEEGLFADQIDEDDNHEARAALTPVGPKDDNPLEYDAELSAYADSSLYSLSSHH